LFAIAVVLPHHQITMNARLLLATGRNSDGIFGICRQIIAVDVCVVIYSGRPFRGACPPKRA
jgi:hypothetical protein